MLSESDEKELETLLQELYPVGCTRDTDPMSVYRVLLLLMMHGSEWVHTESDASIVIKHNTAQLLRLARCKST